MRPRWSTELELTGRELDEPGGWLDFDLCEAVPMASLEEMPLRQQNPESLALQLLRENPQAAYSFFWHRDTLHLIAERQLLGGPSPGGVAVHKILPADDGESFS